MVRALSSAKDPQCVLQDHPLAWEGGRVDGSVFARVGVACACRCFVRAGLHAVVGCRYSALHNVCQTIGLLEF